MNPKPEVVIVTGSSGFIGSALINKLAGRFALIGFDRAAARQPPPAAECVCIDLTSEEAIAAALQRVRTAYGERIASVVHLAAYFDLTGEPNPLYEQITVRGSEKLLHALQSFEVEQFVLASTMLVHAPGKRGRPINEDPPLDPKLPYRESKIRTERLISEGRGSIPAVFVRPAGVYDDLGHAAYLAHQIARIYERKLISHVYPGDLDTGQSYLHLDDLTDALGLIIERRKELPPELPLLLGEPEALSFAELQRMIARLIHDEEWATRQIQKAIAKTGAWIEGEVLDEDPFIRPWMVDISDDHYEPDTSRARKLLSWEPKHSLRNTLAKIVDALEDDPAGWYRANKLNAAQVAADKVKARETQESADHLRRHEMMREYHAEMRQMHLGTIWVHFLVIALGVWLLSSPFQFALFDPAAAGSVRDITEERGLWESALRNALTGWSDIGCGLLLMLFGGLALSPRFAWAQWGTTVVGLWLLFAPLFFLDTERRGLHERYDCRRAGDHLLRARADDARHESCGHDGREHGSAWLDLLALVVAATPADHRSRLLRLSHRPLSHGVSARPYRRGVGAVLLRRRRQECYRVHHHLRRLSRVADR